jgi:hypothetical protein
VIFANCGWNKNGHSSAELASRISAMRIPLWLKVGWTIWVVAWVPLYARQYGAQNFLYFCDLGNFFIVVALWTESALLFSWQATGLLLFQSLYTIDLLGAFFTSKHLIGGTEYMFDSRIPLLLRLLSLFHLVVPPLLLWAIARLGYDPRGWKLQILTLFVVVPINYFWRPAYNVNFARGLFHGEQHTVPGFVYLAAYLVLVSLLIYFPTHLALQWWTHRRHRNANLQPSKDKAAAS